MTVRKLDPCKHLDKVMEEYGDQFSSFNFFENMMKRWREILSMSSTEKRKPMVSHLDGEYHEETYSLFIDFWGENTYELEWDIVEAFQWLRSQHQKPIKLSLEQLLPYVQQETLLFDDEQKKVPHHPLIVAKVQLSVQDIVILNGNHRIVESLQSGIRELEGFYISHDQHRHWLLSEEMRHFYEWTADMYKISNELENKELGRQVDEENLYRQLYIEKK
jgi:hypothetical protein